MTSIITRSTGSSPKGSPLTASELDGNFINLNQDKVEFTRAINTTAGDLTGGGDLSGDRTLGLASTGISAGTVNNSTTQLTPLTLDIKGRVIGVGTPQTLTPAFSSLTGTPTTLAGYGITDAQATITGAATTIDTEDLSALKVLVSNAGGKVAASDVSTTTLGYLDATSSVQGQLDSKQATTAKNAANGYAGLDANAKLPTSLLPALAISEYLGSVANQAARLALTGQKGDWCSQTNDGKVYVITGDDPTDNANWTALTYPVTPGITLNGTSIAPGDTATISAATTNTLTIGTGLSGTSFNGSAATTIAIDSSVVTLTGTQTLTNKTLTSPTINGGTANNVAIGGTTPAAGNFTTLSSTGNTTLGDAAGDTLTINGTAVSAPNGLNVNSNQLVLSGGNVGIGTSSPAYKLDVRGLATTGVAAPVSTVSIPDTNGNRGGFAVLNASGGTLAGIAAQQIAGGNYPNAIGRLDVWVQNGAVTTTAATFDSSGNLGLGVTPSGWYSTLKALQIGGTASVSQLNAGAGNQQANFGNNFYYNASGVETYIQSTGAQRYRQLSGAGHVWEIAPSGTAGNAISFTQAMTLDASGNLLLGTTTSTGLLLEMTSNNQQTCGINVARISPSVFTDIYGCGTGGGWVGEIRFFTSSNAAASERARIKSGGGLALYSASTSNDTIDSCNNQPAGTQFSTFIGRHSATGPATGTVSVRIFTNGNIVNTNNSYGAISDVRLKENIIDATKKLEQLNQVRVVNFNMVGETQKQLGVIAQELEQVFPGMVDESPDRDAEGNDLGTTTKSVKYSVFVPMLIKAVQELHTEIETLKQRIH